MHAQNLHYMMSNPKRKSIQFFASEPIFQALTTENTLSAAEQRRAESIPLRARKDHATLQDGDSASSATSDDEADDDVMTPVRPLPGRRKKGRLSVLRPKSGKFSGKSKGIGSKGHKGKGKAPLSSSEAPNGGSDTDEVGSNTSSEDNMSVDTPTQALSPGRVKRKFSTTIVDAELPIGRRKRATSASITPESPPTTVESDDDSDENDEGSARDMPSIGLRHDPSNSKHMSNAHPAMTARIISTPLPTYEPNASRDSWICTFDGCSQRIYGCSKELGRQLITEHLEDHTKGREKEVGILWREQDKLRLPVE